MTPRPDDLRPARRDLWIALVALTAYALLAQHTLYNRDAHVLLLLADEGARLHNHHLLFFPGLNLLKAIGTPLGLSLYGSAVAYTALGTAIGVACTHAANVRLGLRRTEALLATALVAACPAVVFFATVVEVHGPFFAFAGLAFWMAVRFTSAPGAGSAALVGVAVGGASLAHATGLLLPLAIAPVAAGRLRDRRGLALAGLALAVAVAIALGVPMLLRATGDLPGGEESAAGHLGLRLRQVAATGGLAIELPRALGFRLLREWLWPYLPLSVAGLATLAAPGVRRRALLFAAALAGYLLLATVLLWPFRDNDEHGAYLLPLAWPAALLVVRALPAATRVLVLLSVVVALVQIGQHDRPERSRAFADGLRAHAAPATPFLIVGYYDDVEALVIHLLPELEGHYLALQRLPPLSEALLPRLLARLDQEIDAQRSAGHPAYISDDACTSLSSAFFADPAVPGSQPLLPRLLAHLRQRYEFERVDSGGFAGYLLHPRP